MLKTKKVLEKDRNLGRGRQEKMQKNIFMLQYYFSILYFNVYVF